jgi:hypothetical protein
LVQQHLLQVGCNRYVMQRRPQSRCLVPGRLISPAVMSRGEKASCIQLAFTLRLSSGDACARSTRDPPGVSDGQYAAWAMEQRLEHFDPLISRLLLLVARARDQWRPRRAPRGAGRMRIICLSVPPSLSLQELGLCPSVLASAMCGVRWSLLLHMKFQGIFRLRAMAELGLEPDAAAAPAGPAR